MWQKYFIRRLQKIPHKDFLLHGSSTRLRSGRVMPKKPQIVFRNSPELFKKRVYATPVIPIALLYAVIHQNHSVWDWCFMRQEGKLNLYCRVKKSPLVVGRGYIHVLPRAGFENKRTGVTFRSRQSAQATEVIRVPPRIFDWLMKNGEFHLVRRFPEPGEILWQRPFRRVSRAR